MPRTLPAALLALAAVTSGCLPARPLATTSSPVPALEVEVDESFYDVAGLDPRELNVQLMRRGPRHEGRSWQGRTDFRVAYSYLARSGGDGCRADEPRVSVRLVTTLPRWKDRKDAPAQLGADWDLYLSRLRDHEEGHRRIAIDAGRDLLLDVAVLSAPDCEALRKSALRIAADYQSLVTFEQRGWDERTQYGLVAGN